MQLGYYEFASYGDLFLLGAIGLFLVARNWWDIIRYGLHRQAPTGLPAAPAGGRLGLMRRLRRREKSVTHKAPRRHG